MKIEIDKMSERERRAMISISKKDGIDVEKKITNINAILIGRGVALHKPRETYL